MIKHILKIVWNQRRSNGWIFAELLIVSAIVWVMVDAFYVDYRTYQAPMGFEMSNVWRFKLSEQSLDDATDSMALSEPEKLTQLMQQIRLCPEVEEVCATFFSCPYSQGNSWREFRPLDGDTTLTSQRSFQIRNVTPEYFRLFRLKTPEGKPVEEELLGTRNALVVTPEMAEVFYHGEQARGREVFNVQLGEAFRIASVCNSVRNNEFERPEPFVYQVLDGELYNQTVTGFGAQYAELCVRMKQPLTQDGMNRFLEQTGDRLAAGPLFVYGVTGIDYFRNRLLAPKERQMSNTFSQMAFLLVNVFFGIIGTFWLRMQNRRGEIGLRMALGAYRVTLERYMYTEGLCLLALTLPVTLIFAANMIGIDYLDTYRLPMSAARFVVTFGITYLLMSFMILIGIWFPVRKAVRMAPAEALHYE